MRTRCLISPSCYMEPLLLTMSPLILHCKEHRGGRRGEILICCLLGDMCYLMAHSMANSLSSAVPWGEEVKTSKPHLVYGRYSHVLSPDKVWRDGPPHAVLSLHSDVKTVVNYSLSSFRFLGIRYQATVSTWVPGYTDKTLQVVPLKPLF